MSLPSEFDESPLGLSMVSDELCKSLMGILENDGMEGYGVQEALIVGYMKNHAGPVEEKELAEFIQMIKDAWLNIVIVKGVISGDIRSRWSEEKGCLVFSAGGDGSES